MNTLIRRLSGAAALLLMTGPALALEFKQVQTNDSAVTFGFRQMGVPLDGKFNKFSAQLSFDPAQLAKAQARIDIDLASIDTGSAEGNEEVVGKKWFNVKDYPTASFVSTGIKALGGNRYQAFGKLSIKGRTQDVAAPVTFQSDGKRGIFEGTFEIKRLDYAIGEGEWTDVSSVANEIQVKFHVVVNASASKK
ncbi:protein YceI [mine drainage metagenome]|uniref:Protein YceI n=1 Tax=mine drainage metagenome TaxID=410659 RepID=A0A1J5T310_9ZZZZ